VKKEEGKKMSKMSIVLKTIWEKKEIVLKIVLKTMDILDIFCTPLREKRKEKENKKVASISRGETN